MRANPDMRPSSSPTGTDYERGAERLRATIVAACERGAAFPARVEAALRATLALLAAEPELARLLAVQPHGAGADAHHCYREGLKRYGALLRRAAASDPQASVQPDFLEPAVIAGIVWQIARSLLADGPEALEGLLPALLEFVLVYYLDPAQATRIARSARPLSP
jgi:hypothetical protein